MRSVDGGAWTLAWMPGFELPAQPLATLRFEAGRAEGSALRIEASAATRMMCAQPEGRMAQEAQFLAALASATQVRREADRLELRTASNALAVSARLGPP